MKFLVLKDAFVENRYRTKGTIADLPDKYAGEPSVFKPVESTEPTTSSPEPLEPKTFAEVTKQKPVISSEESTIDESEPVGTSPEEPKVYISKKDRAKLGMPPED